MQLDTPTQPALASGHPREPLSNIVYKERASRYDDIYRRSPWHRLYLSRTLDFIINNIRAHSHVLDAGGGTGQFTIELARRGFPVTLVDSSPEMIAIAKAKLDVEPQDVRSRVRIFTNAIADLDILDLGKFDVVLCTHVLPLCADLRDALAKLANMLSPDGRLICDIDGQYRWALIESLSNHISNAKAIMELGIDRDENILGVPYNLPTSDEFQAIIHRVGLRVELRRGLQYFAPYFHVFAPSTAFLDHASLPPPTRNVSTSSGFDELCGLEDLAAERLPVDMAGWIQYILTLAE